MRISDWSSDVCSSDRSPGQGAGQIAGGRFQAYSIYGGPAPLGCHRRDDLFAGTARFLFSEGARFFECAAGGRDQPRDTAHPRSEERSVGKACVSKCRSGWSPDPSKEKKKQDEV